ncbi:MAG: hypothetical protein WD382_01420 [Halofilum sp. (in: g-proteobacteria)]
MASLDMGGSHPLTDSKIDEIVTKTSPGNYALGYQGENSFIVQYVGRSDSDVNSRLHDWAAKGKHKRFKFSYASNRKAAFEKECRNFHDFGGTEKLQNSAHPDRPNDSDWECPVCTIFD